MPAVSLIIADGLPAICRPLIDKMRESLGASYTEAQYERLFECPHSQFDLDMWENISSVPDLPMKYVEKHIYSLRWGILKRSHNKINEIVSKFPYIIEGWESDNIETDLLENANLSWDTIIIHWESLMWLSIDHRDRPPLPLNKLESADPRIWNQICRYYPLNAGEIAEILASKCRNYLDWTGILTNSQIDFPREYAGKVPVDDVDWLEVSDCPGSIKVIELFGEFMDFDMIEEVGSDNISCGVTVDQILTYSRYMNVYTIVSDNPKSISMDERVINEFIDNHEYWEAVCSYEVLTEEEMDKYSDYLYWDMVIERQNFSADFAMKYLDHIDIKHCLRTGKFRLV